MSWGYKLKDLTGLTQWNEIFSSNKSGVRSWSTMVTSTHSTSAKISVSGVVIDSVFLVIVMDCWAPFMFLNQALSHCDLSNRHCRSRHLSGGLTFFLSRVCVGLAPMNVSSWSLAILLHVNPALSHWTWLLMIHICLVIIYHLLTYACMYTSVSYHLSVLPICCPYTTELHLTLMFLWISNHILRSNRFCAPGSFSLKV